MLRIRLRYRIIALTILCLVPVAAASTWALVRVATGYLWDDAESDAMTLADGARRVTRHAMVANEWRHVASVLHDVAMHGDVRFIRLYNEQGRLKVSTDGWRHNLSLASGGCVQCHPNALDSDLPPGICAHWNGSALRVYHRIPNEPACSSAFCHPPPAKVASLGLLEVETDMSHVVDRVHDVHLRALIWGLVVLTAAAVPLIFGLGWAVERPMAESLRLVGEVSRENFRVRSRLRRSDEWAELWEAFDSMASSLARAQAELEALNRDLEAQVEERTQELKRALETSQESDRMKTEFLANVSHEFSTPLQGVIGYAELLLDGIDGDLTSDQRRDVQTVLRNGRRLMDWVEDLLELARLDGHTRLLCVDRIRIQDLAEEAAEAGRRQAASKGVEVTCDADRECPAVIGDTGALRRVLLHLVENAVRHTDAGRIVVQIAEASPGWAEITVEDTGPGMAPEVLHAALNGFSSKGGGGGLAVGLTLARRLVELHGGSFRVDSAPGQGTRVRLLLPEGPRGEDAEGRPTEGDIA